MHTRARWSLLLLMPLCLAWQGAGVGNVEVGYGRPGHERPHRSVDLSATFAAWERLTGGLELVGVFDVPGTDTTGALTVTFDDIDPRGSDFDFESDGPRLDYTEYGDDGELVFAADRGEGEIEFTPVPAGHRLRLDVRLAAADGSSRWLRVSDASLVSTDEVPVGWSPEPERPHVGPDVVVADQGCDGSGGESWDDDDDDVSSSGWDSEDDGGSGSGCEGDDLGSEGESTTEPAGGCEGDDTSGSSGCDAGDTSSSAASCGEGCEGDALAGAVGRPRRSPVIARLVAWLPWLLVFAFIRAMRGPNRRAAAPAARRPPTGPG